jgi:hypothetical protein
VLSKANLRSCLFAPFGLNLRSMAYTPRRPLTLMHGSHQNVIASRLQDVVFNWQLRFRAVAVQPEVSSDSLSIASELYACARPASSHQQRHRLVLRNRESVTGSGRTVICSLSAYSFAIVDLLTLLAVRRAVALPKEFGTYVVARVSASQCCVTCEEA